MSYSFNIKEIQKIPFEVEHTRFTAFWGELAEIEYTGKNNSVLLRIAPGTDDVSGSQYSYSLQFTHGVSREKHQLK